MFCGNGGADCGRGWAVASPFDRANCAASVAAGNVRGGEGRQRDPSWRRGDGICAFGEDRGARRAGGMRQNSAPSGGVDAYIRQLSSSRDIN